MAESFLALVALVILLLETLLLAVVVVGGICLRHALLITWIAWWLWGVNWNNAWDALAKGGWVVLVLLTLIAALAWSAMAPGSYNFLGQFTLGNFWWQLGAVALIVLSALFCGWVQGVFGWAPAEVCLEPPAATYADHGHHH